MPGRVGRIVRKLAAGWAPYIESAIPGHELAF